MVKEGKKEREEKNTIHCLSIRFHLHFIIPSANLNKTDKRLFRVNQSSARNGARAPSDSRSALSGSKRV